MIVGKHDETKGFKVYIPRERVVVMTKHVKNVETLDKDGNHHLQEQLRRQELALEQSILKHDEVGKRKEQLTSNASTDRDTADQEDPQRG